MKADEYGWYNLIRTRRFRVAFCSRKEWICRGALPRAWIFSFSITQDWSSILKCWAHRWQLCVFGLNIAHVYRKGNS